MLEEIWRQAEGIKSTHPIASELDALVPREEWVVDGFCDAVAQYAGIWRLWAWWLKDSAQRHNSRQSMDQSTHVVVNTNSGQFVCFIAGAVDRPLALCLHGYPDTPWTWRYLAPTLVEAGWRVVAPYLRGFAPTVVDRADQAGPFVLGRDANELHDALGGDERAVLIGHDWGAAAAYEASASAPERWSKVIAASWPPWPAAIDLTSFEQMRRSWYVFVFQTEAAPKLVGDEGFLTALWRLWSPGYDAAQHVKAAVAALNGPQHGALVLRHYRALFSHPSAEPTLPRHPTLYIHGENDGCIGSELVADSLRHLPVGSVRMIIPGVGHFPQVEAPTRFNDAVRAFLVGHAGYGNDESTDKVMTR